MPDNGELEDHELPRTPLRIRVGAITVSGGLERPLVKRIVYQCLMRFRRCYLLGWRRNPQLRGTVRVRFSIGPNGHVGDVQTEGDLPDDEMVSCVVGGFASLWFPPTDPPSRVQVALPVRFGDIEDAGTQ